MTSASPARSGRWTRLDAVASPRLRVTAFSFVLAASGIIGFVILTPHLVPRPAPLWIPWPVFALVYYLAETNVIEVHFRRETHSFSLSEVPAVIGLFFVDPPTYVLGLVVGAFAALVKARQPAAKLFFNLSHFLLGCVVSLGLFYFISSLGGPPRTPDPIDWTAAFAATLATSTIAALAIATVITLSGGAPQFERLPEMLQVGGLFAITNTALALLAVTILWVDPIAVWLVFVPVGTLFIAYRAYLSERQKHESLELLYESSRIFQRSPELDSAILALLEHARVMFRTDRAEMILAGGEDGIPLRTSAGPGDRTEGMAPAPDRTAILARLRDDPKPFIFDAGDELPATHERLFRYAMVSPLSGESGVLGAMLVADRMGENDNFGPDELRMLETVANQAAVALENGQLEQSLTELSRLKEELRHQAFHDPLTGLANRALFVQAVEERLVVPIAADGSGATSGRPISEGGPDRIGPEVAAEDLGGRAAQGPIVLFLDLDDFKIVNDTLGHGIGDRLLQGVAERVAAAIRSDDLAARLGGDEFAILLAGAPDVRQAILIADRIATSLQLPFHLGGRELTIGASIGLAVAHAGQGAQDLLRNADVAMYAAKSRGKSQLAIWDPDMHTAIVERHELSTALTRAITLGQLRVAYQPLVALDGHGVVGFEALARWNHPTRGPMPPELFVRLAEESGAIIALGRTVLLEACRQAAAWTGEPGMDAAIMSVNLSPYQVHRAEFTDEVLGILADTGLDPAHLVLEMTETAMFSDMDATISKLQALRQHGVQIAVDDFGTGYSSLRWLRQFPVDILKLAREFIVDGDAGSDDWAFAHAIVVLGRTLGLRIVAEGIETTRQRDRLEALGCDYGQGFLFARPAEATLVPSIVASINRDWARGPRAAGESDSPLKVRSQRALQAPPVAS